MIPSSDDEQGTTGDRTPEMFSTPMPSPGILERSEPDGPSRALAGPQPGLPLDQNPPQQLPHRSQMSQPVGWYKVLIQSEDVDSYTVRE